MLLVTASLKATALSQAEKNFPNLSDKEKANIANKRYTQILSDKKKIRQKLKSLSQEIYKDNYRRASLLGKRPETYLIASDPYYFYGLTKDIAKGHPIMTKRKGAKYFNHQMLAPVGYWEAISLHPFVGFATYKIIHAFYPQASLMFGVSFTPIFLIVFSSIFFLLICRILKVNAWASGMGLLFFLLARILLRRTFFGWYDSDPYNVLFPLMIIYLFLKELSFRKNLKKTVILALLCAGAVVLYAFFWQGWVYLFSLLLLSGAAIVLCNHFLFKEKTETKNIIISLSVIAVGIFLGIVSFFGFSQFFFLFEEGATVLKNFFVAKTSPWPDVYVSVGELHEASFKKFLELIGGLPFLLISLLGLGYAAKKSFKKLEEENLFKFITLLAFFASSLLMALQAQRFTLLFLVPLGLFSALGFQLLYQLSQKLIALLKTTNSVKKILWPASLVLLTIILVISPLANANDLALRFRPIFDEVWDAALTKIKNETPQDSIVNTWWPPGHFIKAMAERRVTSDGGTINVPQAYWMAQILLESNEKNALGMLRMLNTSANEAAKYLENLGFKTSEAVKMLKTITPLSRQQAKDVLKNNLSEIQTNKLISLTHGNPPASYLFIYNDLIEQNIAISLVGNWDIAQMEKINQNPDLLKKMKKMDTKDYVHFLWDLQGGMPRIGDTLTETSRKDDLIIFQNGVQANLKDETCRISSKTFGQGIPRSIIFVKDERIKEKKFASASLNYSALIFQEESTGRYQCILMDENLARSLLMKLYYLGGKGLKYLEPFVSEQGLTGRTTIYAYRVNWEEFLKDFGE
ncbi:MAG: STT3 domain-containing protein [Candidatus Aceula meridiana]|nr:STT3 domain-containing protein [Candidatus Aceula meridiana]